MRGWTIRGVGAWSVWMLFTAACGPTAPDADGLASRPPENQGLVGSQSTSFQDGVAPSSAYAGTRDAMIEEAHPDTHHGTDTSVSASGDTPSGSGQETYVLLQWDVSSIPSTARVRSASLTVTVSDKAEQTYSLYALTRAWTESQVTWKQADSGHDWTSNGADGSGDRDVSSLGSITAVATGTYTVTLNAMGVEAVQQWVSTPSRNHGVVLANKDNDNRLELRSREYSTKTSRPRLTVSWDPAGTDTGTPLDASGGTYPSACDGSGAVWLDATHFLDFNDETQAARAYTQGRAATLVQSTDLSGALGLSSSDEADFEDAARVGNRVYVTGSHARDSDGKKELMRYKFSAFDLSGTLPALQLRLVGTSSNLLVDMLNPANWTQPDSTLLALLADRTQLSTPTVADLSPKKKGLNIEGLASLPTGELVIGLRNPLSGSSAILVTLSNPDAFLAGATARFGQALLMNLGGAGIRGLTWSEAHQAMFILSGPSDDSSSGPFTLWRWSGGSGSAPSKVVEVTDLSDDSPEAIVAYPGSKDLQLLLDMGSHPVGSSSCKSASTSSKFFNDVIVHVE